ncbi:hypothetical protein LshimejAT787_0606060 [Lyophyllum shimeji]|uniref:C2H2-type domain-containing protein n=1 Tax=Lyophyllum shimeji TaxID=47721 RepID=A0A9P3ULM6_LYOSH|nr:hypothetical protein LshimejAT787_0606060 [Lyophyllum shimeji]
MLHLRSQKPAIGGLHHDGFSVRWRDERLRYTPLAKGAFSSLSVNLATNMTNQRVTNIDSLRRDPDDGAYHCPRCDAPFTRRSNLRRHYTIHTRNRDIDVKCQTCGKAFTSSSAFQSHVIQCTSSFWETSSTTLATSQPLHGLNAIAQPADNGGPSHQGHGSAGIDMFALDQHPTFTPEDNLNLDELLSTLANSSPTPPSLSSPFTDPNSLFDENWGTRDSSRSSTDESAENSELRSARNFRPHYRSRLGDQHVGRRKKEKPMYTRRQVEDMLEIVSNTFVGRIEEIIQRTHSANVHGWRPVDCEMSSQPPSGSCGYDT